MKMCEYANNLLSLDIFLFLINKIIIKTNFSLENIYDFYNIITYDTKTSFQNFDFNVEQKGEIGDINLIKTSYNDIQLNFIDKYIKKYGKVPVILEFFYDYSVENIINLKENIRGNNPNNVYLIFG